MSRHWAHEHGKKMNTEKKEGMINSEIFYIFRKKWGRRGTEKEGHTHTHKD